MKKSLTFILLFISVLAYSQNTGINFQGVGRNSSGAVLASTKISLRFSVIQSSETGTVEYVESKEVTTNAQGIFSVVIGDGIQISKTGNFSDINWKINPIFLKVEMDPAGGSSFVAMGTTRLQAVPFAYYANGVNADNVDGVLSASKGGTGVASISAFKTALAIDQINNTSDLAKPISTATQTALDTKVSTSTFSTTVASKANTSDLALKAPIDSPTFTGTVAGITKAMVGLGSVNNTSDLAKPISTLTQEALDTKVSTATFSTTVATKANATDLALKAPIESPTFTGTVAGITKAMVGLGSVNNTADLAKPISTATQEALDTKVSATTFSTTVANKANTVDLALKAPLESPTFTGTVTGITKAMVGLSDVENTADLAKPISTVTEAALDTKVSTATFSTTMATKENTANKSTATDLGGLNPSDVLFPTQKAVKNYITANTASGNVADGGITTIKLADEAVTNDKIATGINKSKVGLGNVENTALTTWQGSTNLTTVGTITSGTWSGTAIDYSKLNLAQSITNADVADGAIGWRQLNISKGDIASLGFVGDEDIIIYQAGQGLTETTVSIPNGRRSGSSLVTTTFDLIPIATNNIQDDAITNDKIATGVNKSKVGLANVENTALSTWSGSSNLSSVGIINTGTWSGTTIALNKGGTGATNAADARVNLGLVIGTNVQAPLTSGIDYLAPNGSAVSLTSFPTLNQNTTGNAATATMAGNISATSNTTLTSLINLNTVGTISSGVWSGTTISVSNGGTGSTNFPSNSILLGNGVNALQTLAPGTSGNFLISNGSAWSSEPITSVPAASLTGTTLPSNIVISSLTSVGVLSNTTVNGKLIVGTTSAITSSAVLEVSSSSQGFLPPRLNSYQRTQIANPVAGLTIWCNNCGNSGEMQVFNGAAWTNMIGGTVTATINLSIGQSHQGGKVFYILEDGDPGYDPNTQHGLIVALADQSSGIDWHGPVTPWPQTGATEVAIGTGLSNTSKIISIQGGTATNYAAGIARAHNGGGYNDWYLPSLDELNKLYLNRSAVGGTWLAKYWTSTESSTASTLFAWFQDFSEFVGFTGVQKDYLKDLNQGVRAIRSF